MTDTLREKVEALVKHWYIEIDADTFVDDILALVEEEMKCEVCGTKDSVCRQGVGDQIKAERQSIVKRVKGMDFRNVGGEGSGFGSKWVEREDVLKEIEE